MSSGIDRSKRQKNSVIRADESFTVGSFCTRLGINNVSFHRMRENGLKARLDGRYVRILGSDYLEYVASLPVAEPGKKKQKPEAKEGTDERIDTCTGPENAGTDR